LRFTVYQQEKRRHNTFNCAVSIYVAETPKASIKDQEAPLPIIPSDSGIFGYGFAEQPFSKQLFSLTVEILARSLANFYGQNADRPMNLQFMRRVNERELAIPPFAICH